MRFKFNLIQLTRWVKNPVQGIQLGFLTSWADNSSTRVPACLGVWVEMDEKCRKEDIKGEVYENKQSSNYCWNSLWQKEPTGRLGMTDWPPTTSRSKFGESWKINRTNLSAVKRRNFGLSCRRDERRLMLKNFMMMCCCDCCRGRMNQIFKLKEDQNRRTGIIW